LAGTILIWFLQSFPSNTRSGLAQSISLTGSTGFSQLSLPQISGREDFSGKYMTDLGRIIFPLVEPIGFGWKEAISLIPGFLAKESIVSTLAVLYSSSGLDLGQAMKREGMTPLKAFCFMLFAMTYVPCIPTLGMIYRESNSGKVTFLAVVIPLTVAWTLSFAVYRTGLFLGF